MLKVGKYFFFQADWEKMEKKENEQNWEKSPVPYRVRTAKILIDLIKRIHTETVKIKKLKMINKVKCKHYDIQCTSVKQSL